MKVRKNTLLILLLGVMVIAGIALSMLFSQQSDQKKELQGKLTLAQKNLALLNNDKLIAQREQLKLQINNNTSQYNDIKSKMVYSEDNINTVDILILKASEIEVEVLEITSSGMAVENMNAVRFQTMNLNIKIQGTTETVAAYVYQLKKTFATGVIKSFTLDVIEEPSNPDEEPEEDSGPLKDTIGVINLVIYSYAGD